MSYLVTVDTSMFSPVGLQPVAVCRLGFNAASWWLARNAISHRRLVSEHGTGLVVWSAQLCFDEPLRFFDADCLELCIGAGLRGGGTQVEVLAAIGAAARFSAVCVPLRLEGGEALAGVPERLAPEVIAAFPGEVTSAPHRSPVPALRAAVLREGAPLAAGRLPLKIHRHQCEVADQWFWPEAVALAAEARDKLGLVTTLRSQVRQIDLLFNRPFFLFDEGEVLSTAHQWKERLVFVHELAAPGDEKPRALVLEQFECN